MPPISHVNINSTHTHVVVVGYSPSTHFHLTCTVELSSSVDVSVNVNTVWTGPVGTVIKATSPMSESLTTYTSTAMIEAARSGNYSCQANVSSSSQFTTGDVMASGTFGIVSGKQP